MEEEKKHTGEPIPPGEQVGLLQDARFRRFALAKTLQLTAQIALVYGLFISVIAEQSTYLAGSAFVLSSVLPSVFLSVPGGLVADKLPNKLVLITVLIIRAAIIGLFLGGGHSLQAVILLTFLTFTAYQFFTPAENEAVVAVTRPENTAGAIALLQALSLAAQVLGAGVLAPLSLDLMGEDGLFLLVLSMLAASAVFYLGVPNLSPQRAAETYRLGWWSALPTGYRMIRRDSTLLQVTVLRVITDTSMLMVLVAAPKFIEDVLNSSTDNAIYIGSPAALGLALGLLVASPLSRHISPRILTLCGFAAFASVLACLPFIGSISGMILDVLPWWDTARSSAGLSQEIAGTIVLLPFAGLGISVVQVASRAAVYQRVQPGLIGQVLATQSALGSLLAVIPTFLAGALLDLLPVTVFLSGLAAVATSTALLGYSAAGSLPKERHPPRKRLSMRH